MIIPWDDEESFEFPLATKRGRLIPNIRKPEYSPEKARDFVEFHERSFGFLQRRSISRTYNCVGMVFANRRVSVEPEHVQTFLDEDGYRQIVESEARQGDVIVYRNTMSNEIVHVGVLMSPIIDDADWLVLGKWGPGGEYLHRKRQTHPTYLEYVEFEYWTERIDI